MAHYRWQIIITIIHYEQLLIFRFAKHQSPSARPHPLECSKPSARSRCKVPPQQRWSRFLNELGEGPVALEKMPWFWGIPCDFRVFYSQNEEIRYLPRNCNTICLWVGWWLNFLILNLRLCSWVIFLCVTHCQDFARWLILTRLGLREAHNGTFLSFYQLASPQENFGENNCLTRFGCRGQGNI